MCMVYAMIIVTNTVLYTHVHGMAVVVTVKYDAYKMSTTIELVKE